MVATELVTLIVLTYKRPDDLREAIPLLVEAISAHPGAELLVVDNDEKPTAEDTVRQVGDARVRYAHEPRPGIAAARNRGLQETWGRDIIVFIDDDERPEPGWLENLLRTHRDYAADAVAGPVVSSFTGEPDAWIRGGRFFDRLRHPTGTEVPLAATNNLLLARPFVETAKLRFDEEFGLSGGSDTVFSLALRKAGGRIVWCDEAVVVDVVPASRATREWVLRRAFRMGNSGARARIHVADAPVAGLRERFSALVQGLGRVVLGAARWVVGALSRSMPDRARAIRMIFRGAGMVGAAFGYTYFEYKRAGKSSAG